MTFRFSRDILWSFLTAENMADEYGRKWDRCLADTVLKTGQCLFLLKLKSRCAFVELSAMCYIW